MTTRTVPVGNDKPHLTFNGGKWWCVLLTFSKRGRLVYHVGSAPTIASAFVIYQVSPTIKPVEEVEL